MEKKKKLLTCLHNDHRLACMISELNGEEYKLDSKSLQFNSSHLLLGLLLGIE